MPRSELVEDISMAYTAFAESRRIPNKSRDDMLGRIAKILKDEPWGGGRGESKQQREKRIARDRAMNRWGRDKARKADDDDDGW
jgi:hypothetical protein